MEEVTDGGPVASLALARSARAPGADADKEADTYAAVWRSFGAQISLVDHRTDWARWAAGRSPHLLLLIRVRGAPAREAVHIAQERLAELPGVELHPSSFLHITVQPLGFITRQGRKPGSGEVAEDELPGLVTRLEWHVAQVPRFEVVLGGVNAFHSAVFLEVSSGGCLQALRRAIRLALGPDLCARLDPHDGYLFHLTVGYFGAQAHPNAVRRALSTLRAGSVRRSLVPVDRVELVRVAADQRVAYPRLRATSHFALDSCVR